MLALVILVASAGSASAATCESLRDLSLTNADVTGAAVVAAGAFNPLGTRPLDVSVRDRFALLPTFCRVTATLKPSSDSDIRIEVWMPETGWNGRFLGVGNGTWAGVIPYVSLAGALRAGYATAGTDAGHAGDTAAFALGHPEKVIDMGYRAVHEMTVQAKAIVAAHYEAPAALSIFSGCSTGGRQGVTEAVRFPTDFDAVIAGAPAVNWMRLHAGRIALNQVVNRTQAHVIPSDKYALLQNAVVQACDALDGVADGVLENPRACRFDPAVLQCGAGNGANCLTPPQVETARSFYAAVRHPLSGEIVMSGLEPGTERLWGAIGGPQPLGTSIEAFRYVVFGDQRWDWRRFNLASDLERASRVDNGVLDSSDPDLRPFFERGGKLLLYHGWSDPQIPAGNTIDFFDRVVGVAGSEAVGRSVQLYMVPGMNQCTGGTGVDTFDTVGAINQWLVTGQAPASIPAARVVDGVIERTRPLCPYGQVAEWNGSGSISDAAAFTCVGSAAQPADSIGDPLQDSR